MTDTEAAEVLAEFRKLKLGPDLCAALDHAVLRLMPRVPVVDVDLAEVARLAA